MKKRIAMIAMMASLVTTTAFAEGVKIDGSIKSAETKTILAPYSGVVGNYAVTAGDAVNMGDALFALRTEQVYADFDGTVTAVFAQPGRTAPLLSRSVTARWLTSSRMCSIARNAPRPAATATTKTR